MGERTRDVLGRVRPSLLAAGALLAGLSCGGADLGPPTTGGIEITTVTSGPDLDADGYAVTIDDATETAIAANGTLERDGLAAGGHRVTLVGIAANCAAEGENPRNVAVVAGEIATVAFQVGCSALPVIPMIAFDTRSGTVSGEIAVVNPDGTGLTNLTRTASAQELAPEWSPDRKKIGFIVDLHDVYVMNADGTGRVKLAHSEFDDVDLIRWSPDGSMLAVETSCCEGANETVFSLLIMHADGSGQHVLPQDAAHPSWSPDGARIAFTDPVAQGIFIVNVDGTGLTPLVSDARGSAWSPDGTRIAFLNDGLQVETIHPDGTGRVPLTSGPRQVGGASWSPDGSRIAFQSIDFAAGAFDVAVMNADGSDPKDLGPGGRGTWSPDGSRIAFVGPGSPADIYVINTDGTGLIDVSNSPDTHEDNPSWVSR